MNERIDLSHLTLNTVAQEQITECVDLLNNIFSESLLGVYLYGSSILGGLQKYSDIDLFVIANRATTAAEKAHIVASLLKISGIYMKGKKRPIEMTIVEKSEVNPWRYPPKFNFQYGEWLREEFEQGNIEPWTSKEMPDLAILIPQIQLASHTLVGDNPKRLLCQTPYKDFITATADALPSLMSEIESDTRNVLLTLARIWCTVTTDTIRSKPAAADWAINRLPEEFIPVMERAKAICRGDDEEYWDDIKELIKACANFMLNEASNQINEVMSSNNLNRSIQLHSH